MQDAKMSLAENLPAHVKIVDISQIYLTEIPYGVFSVIKYQQKDCLIVNNNELKDLKGDLSSLDELKKFDLSFNLLKSVPKSISSCQALVYLNLDHNELKSLPSVLGSLQNLETISASSNKITAIAPEIGALRKLHSLLLKNNEITKIPDNFAHCYRLKNLDLDIEKIIYPPAEIVMEGGRATILWLCDENNVDKTAIEGQPDTEYGTKFEAISAQEKAAEEMMLKRQEHEAEEAAEMLAKIREEEENLRKISENTNTRDELRKKRLQQKMKEEDAKEAKKLSEYLEFMDDVKMTNIREALKEVEDKDIDAVRILAEVTAMFEEEKKRLKEFLAEDEAILKEYAANHKLDMSFISDEMEKILQEEQMMESFTRNAEHELEQMFDMVQEEEGQESAVHKKMAQSFEQDKQQMLQMILRDEDLQRKMFITAQQEQDKVYKALSTQIENIQENLYLLTILENNQKKLDDQVVDDIRGQRSEMAGLLTQLMTKQEERRTELEDAAIMIEQQCEDELANFWLYQYQMLMASKPAKILREEEEAMHAASKAMQLEKPLGDDEYEGPPVLPDAWNTPSAPSADASSATPTAPSDPAPALGLGGQTPRGGVHANAESECCICLDKAPCVAFLPCGHVCCCAECGIVSVCPMCRAQITTTVRLYFTQT